MGYISILKPNVQEGHLTIPFECSDELKKYFTSFHFSVEYSETVAGVPDSILVIPLVCNLLPLVWLTNCSLNIETLDKDFYDGIEKIKAGYVKMYPMLEFKGYLQVKRLASTPSPSGARRNAAFFSGGVDAFATLIAHAQEHPVLLTVRGADIALDDEEGWGNVSKHVEVTRKTFGCDAISIISNFRLFLDYRAFQNLIFKSGENWWHGFQHGIGLLGLAAPLACAKVFSTIYIASSHTEKDQVTCASHPSIDNHVSYCGCRVKHDQYEFTRQEKITHICEYVDKTGQKLFLRVCWISRGGKNCGVCEKCLRTIYGILAEGHDPENFGFPGIASRYNELGKILQEKVIISPTALPLWKDIQERFLENREKVKYGAGQDWIFTYDFDKVNATFGKRLRIFYMKKKAALGRVVRKLFR
ncbi:MAG: hypothetical protein ACOYJE_08910 [Bacteroidaceae bacterium]|jgi:hypothetical protein